MDEKMNAALKGIYDSLTDEQKAKAKACKTMDELAALAGKEGIELPDEALDQVAGGVQARNPIGAGYVDEFGNPTPRNPDYRRPREERGKTVLDTFL